MAPRAAATAHASAARALAGEVAFEIGERRGFGIVGDGVHEAHRLGVARR